MSLTVPAVRGEREEITGFIGVARDVTEVRLAEAARRQAEQRFAAAFEHAPIGVAITGMRGADRGRYLTFTTVSGSRRSTTASDIPSATSCSLGSAACHATACATATSSPAIQCHSWLERLHHAIDNELLVLHAQPIVGICANGIPRYELLVRMLDDDGELIFPAEFIDTAERFDLIGSIDRWVLRNVKALVGIAHGLGTTTVAEFVGDDATLHPPPPPRLASATA